MSSRVFAFGRRAGAALVAALALAAGASCADTIPATQVLVQIDADPEVIAQAGALYVTVRSVADRGGRGGELRYAREFPLAPDAGPRPGDARFPWVVALTPVADDATRLFEVEAEARTGIGACPIEDERTGPYPPCGTMDMPGAFVAETRLRSGYVQGRTVTLYMRLTRNCIGQVCVPPLFCEPSNGTCTELGFTDPSTDGGVGDAGLSCDAEGMRCAVAGRPCELGVVRCTSGEARCEPQGTPLPAGTLCRPVAPGATCDVAEICDGASLDCPDDGFLPEGVQCREAMGACDVADRCMGGSPECPDTKLGAGTPCRPPAGPCDVAEACDGTSAACPPDGFEPGTVVCRARSGDCDAEERCTGTDPMCPADAVAPASQVCRAATGACDVPEFCDGTSIGCPADRFAGGTVSCGSGQYCDGAGNCRSCTEGAPCTDGIGACAVGQVRCAAGVPMCTVVGRRPPGFVCRASAGPCDVGETCDGTTDACPEDTRQPMGHPCRSSAGPCDSVERCDGTSPACPEDRFAPATTTCRPSAGVCDVPETCTGTGPSCPSDGFVRGGAECRPATGPCDLAESCTGTSPVCPANLFFPSSTVCRPSAGDCDVPENCTGSSPGCPPDRFQDAGVMCGVGGCGVCPGGSASCNDASCGPDGGGVCDCDDMNDCTTNECEIDGGCRHLAEPPGHRCFTGCPFGGSCDGMGLCICDDAGIVRMDGGLDPPPDLGRG